LTTAVSHSAAKPKVSVIVPTRNRHALVGDTVESLLAQDFPGDQYEIIVVDDGSDRPVEVPDGVRLCRHSEARGPNAARNTGAREAAAELLCYVDDDIEAPPHWLAEIVEGASRHPQATGLGGRIRLRIESNGARRMSCRSCKAGNDELLGGLDLGDVERVTQEYMWSANFAVRKEGLSAVGSFNEALPIYFEELELQDRLRDSGRSVVYLPDAWLWHRRPADAMRLSSRLRKSFRQGYGWAFYDIERGNPLHLVAETARIPVYLAHALLRGCSVGLLSSARASGKLVGYSHHLVSRQRRTASEVAASETRWQGDPTP
jgi:glycosyltransferase involved in cell wall biosynthesis